MQEVTEIAQRYAAPLRPRQDPLPVDVDAHAGAQAMLERCRVLER